MDFSPAGYILIPFGLAFFFYGSRPLLWATLACVPFAMLQVVALDFTTILGYQFLGALLILRWGLDGLLKQTSIKPSLSNILAGGFILVCALSLVMTVIKSGTIQVYGQTGGSWAARVYSKEPLRLSVSNFTQVLYPLFGVLLFVVLVSKLKSLSDIIRALNIQIWAAVFLAGMTVIGGTMYSLGAGEIYETFLGLFRTGTGIPNVASPVHTAKGPSFRVVTLGGEPGYTAMPMLLGAGVLVAYTVQKRVEDWIIRLPHLQLMIVTIGLLFNGSTTAYIGTVLLILWTPCVAVVLFRSRKRQLGSILAVLLAGIGLFGFGGAFLQVGDTSFLQWLNNYHLFKLMGETGSGPIRLRVISHSIQEVFLASPLLGVGYGSNQSLSLTSFLLSNVGLIGFGTFVTLLFVIFLNCLTVAKAGYREESSIAFALIVTFVPFIVTLMVAKAAAGIVFGTTWTLLALTEASYQNRPTAARKNRRVTNKASKQCT